MKYVPKDDSVSSYLIYILWYVNDEKRPNLVSTENTDVVNTTERNTLKEYLKSINISPSKQTTYTTGKGGKVEPKEVVYEAAAVTFPRYDIPERLGNTHLMIEKYAALSKYFKKYVGFIDFPIGGFDAMYRYGILGTVHGKEDEDKKIIRGLNDGKLFPIENGLDLLERIDIKSNNRPKSLPPDREFIPRTLYGNRIKGSFLHYEKKTNVNTGTFQTILLNFKNPKDICWYYPMRVFLYWNDKFPYPGECVVLATTPACHRYNLSIYQDTTPFVKTGIWFETGNYSSGIVLDICGARNCKSLGNEDYAVTNRIISHGFLYKIAVRDRVLLIETTDYKLYPVGTKVALIKNWTLGSAKKEFYCDKVLMPKIDDFKNKAQYNTEYRIAPLSFFGIDKDTED